MSDDSELVFLRGLKGKFAGKKLAGVTFVSETTRAEGRRVHSVGEEFYGDWYVGEEGSDEYAPFPTSEELDELIAKGFIAELTPEPRPHTAAAGRVRVMIYDGTGEGFADRNDGHDSSYQQVLDSWPWAAPPALGLVMELGGNPLTIDYVIAGKDGTTIIQLTADESDQVEAWHEDLPAQGYKLVREITAPD